MDREAWYAVVHGASKSQTWLSDWTEVLSDSCHTMDCSIPSFSDLHYLPSLLKLKSIESAMPSNHLILSCPLYLLPSIFLIIRVSFPVSRLSASSGQSIGASASTLVLLTNIEGWFPLGLTGLISLLSKRLSRVFSAPQFESINSSVLSLLYGAVLTSVHDHWENHSFDYADLCWQSNVSAF